MSNNTSDNKPVLVVGGGWAGLSAAVTLSGAGIPVTLLESAKQLGGRARCAPFADYRVDNGQHIMLGAYHDTLALLDQIGVAESQIRRTPLALNYLNRKGEQDFSLRINPSLPAPLHLAWGLITSKGLGRRDKLKALMMAFRLQVRGFKLKKDTSVLLLLKKHRQSARLIQSVWEPICLAALNTPIATASAQAFLNVLRDSFSRINRDSDTLLFSSDLCSALPKPALDYIEQNGGRVKLGKRVGQLVIENNQISGAVCGEEKFAADDIILATPPHITHKLIAPHPALKTQSQQLEQLDYEPICTVYLEVAEPCHLAQPMTGLIGTLSQWVFDRRLTNQDKLLAIVISGPGEHMKWDNDTLIQKVIDELSSCFELPAVVHSLVIREKRATFSCTPQSLDCRPETETVVKGLWLAGDYIDSPYPATLEGAVISGRHAAHSLLQQRATR